MVLISRESLRGRLNELPRDHYLTVFSVMKGVALANAAFTLAAWVESSPTTLYPLVLWVASFAAVILTYQANMFGTAFIFWRPTVLELGASFVLGIIEFLLFSLAMSGQLAPWVLAFSAFSVTGGYLAFNAHYKTDPSYYDVQCREQVEDYARAQLIATRLAIGSGVIWLAIGISYSLGLIAPIAAWPIAILALGNMGGALAHQGAYIRKIESQLLLSAPARRVDEIHTR